MAKRARREGKLCQTVLNIEPLLNEHDVARITNMSLASVRRWRLFREGPKFLKLGAAVRYKAEDISVWLKSRPTGGCLDATAQRPDERRTI
jgi:predicted DNA-binding transcriptional regulator AlpA